VGSTGRILSIRLTGENGKRKIMEDRGYADTQTGGSTHILVKIRTARNEKIGETQRQRERERERERER
jgi:hypothetical protein